MARPLLLFVISSLFSGACSLTCHMCMPDGSGAPCTPTTMDCPTQCGSLRVVSWAGGQQVQDMSMKVCVMPPMQCMTGSLNVGLMKMVVNAKCCKTDKCNAQDPPATTGGANGKECYTCNGADCNAKMKCEGVEDQCISANFQAGDQKMAVKGCASKTVCSGELAQQLGETLKDLKCCTGNMCNGPAGSGSGSGRSGGTAGGTGGVAEIKSCAAATIGLSLLISLLFH